MNPKDDVNYQVQMSLTEFRTNEKQLSATASEAKLILEEIDKLYSSKLAKKDQRLLKEAIKYYTEISQHEDFWKNTIPDNFTDFLAIFKAINNTLGHPAKNKQYKNRLNACFWVTENYLTLGNLIAERLKANKNGIFLKGNFVHNNTINGLLGAPFQLLARQILFTNTWLEQLSESSKEIIEQIKSIKRKFIRLITSSQQIMAAIEAASRLPNSETFLHPDNLNNQAIMNSLEVSFCENSEEPNIINQETSPQLQDTTLNDNKQKKDNLVRILSDFVQTPPQAAQVSDSEHSETSFDLELNHTGQDHVLSEENHSNFVLPPRVSPIPQNRPCSFEVCPLSSESELLYSNSETSSLDSVIPPVSPSPKEELAKQAIKNLKDQIFKSNLVYSGFFATRHQLTISYEERKKPITPPARVKKIINEISLLLERRKERKTAEQPYSNSYQGLVGRVLQFSIEAEYDKPLFGKRSQETANFYETMFETLNIDVNASLEKVRDYIVRKDKKFWGNWWHERPTTVEKILNIIDSAEKSDKEKLKQVIYTADQASITNGYLLNLRSENTEKFYQGLTSLLVFKDQSPLVHENDSQPDNRGHRYLS